MSKTETLREPPSVTGMLRGLVLTAWRVPAPRPELAPVEKAAWAGVFS